MSINELKQWTRENMLEYSRLIEVKKLVEKIEGHLRDMNFINDEMQKTDDDFQHIYRSVSVTNEQEAIDECYIIKFIVAGAFYPNYFYTSQASEEDALKRLSGKDPKTTICVRKFDDTPALYHKQLVELFSICSQDIAVSYEQFKAFVEFKKSSDIITKISLGVYLALFLKQMKREELVLFKIKSGKENAKRQLEILQAEESLNYQTSVTSRITVDKMDSLSDPNLVIKDLNEFFVRITNLDQIGHFYAQIDDDEHNNLLEQITECLNQSLFTKWNNYELKIGMLVATLFFDSLENCDFVRARIDKINEKSVEVFYIDYGNREEKDIDLIFKLPAELSKIPYQAISCSLINMKLKDSKMLNKEWRDKAIDQFSDFLNKAKRLKAKIFSIVENTVRITLFEVKTVAEIDILKTMLKLELVEYCEETQLSKDNNRQRFNMYYMNDKNLKSNSHFIKIRNITDALDDIEYEDSYDKTFEIVVENPLKINLHPMTRSLHKIVNVSIGTESCNRILLDDEPETNCSSLIVASNFSKRTNNQNDRISMRETCLFSKLKGIVSLCLMTFAPYAELRVDKKGKQYTGVLCGLGFDKQNSRPINTDNDIENEFECEFDEDDFKKVKFYKYICDFFFHFNFFQNKINTIRFCINGLIGDEESGKKILQNQAVLRKKQSDNRQQVFYLLQKNRKLIENSSPYHNKFKWNMIPEKCYNEESSIIFIEKKHMINKAFYMGIRTVDFYKFQN
jgi:ATP-dependent RNA helicase TDRD9